MVNFTSIYNIVEIVYAGSVVVQGKYLKKIKILKYGIHFIDYQPNNKVYQYSHVVIATILSLHPVTRRGICKWRLDTNYHERISNVIQE